jgi:PAS domain S-box-containing protein
MTKERAKANQELIDEITSLKKRIQELKKFEADHKPADKELQRSNDLLRAIIDAAPTAIIGLDLDGHVHTVWNRSAEKMLGWSAQEVMGRPLPSVQTESQEEFRRFRERIRNGLTLDGVEVRRQRKDGTPIDYSIYASPLYDPEGRIIGNIAILVDITERKHAEKALRESEEKFRGLVEGMNETLYRMSLPDGKYEYVSPAAKLVLGYSAEEILSNPKMVHEVIHPDFRSYLEEKWEKLIKGEVSPTYEYKIIDPEGKERWILQSNKGIFDDRGKIIAIEGLCRDITNRKQVEEEIRRVTAFLDSIVENIPDMIFVKDARDLRFVRFNRAGEELLGYSRNDLLGKNDYDFFPKEQADFFTEKDRNVLLGGNIADVPEEPIQTRDKGERILHTQKVPILNERGKPEYLLGISEDITDRKRAEEEKQSLEERLQRAEKMEALGTLAGGVAHDLNNVLGVVVGFAELLLSSVDKSSPIRPGLLNIMNGGQKAAAIVQDLLTLARRGVAGRQVLNLNKIIADCQKSPEFESLSSYHTLIRIKTDLEPDLLNISGSPVHLGKSLFNLISNASEAMPQGGTLTIKTTNQYLDKPIRGYDEIREGDYVVLSMSDTGEGIPEADLKRIFEPFYTKKVMGRSGTGLGLAVVWGTVKDHNGYINVESEEGKGSIFTLYFPVTREDIFTESDAVAISEYMGKGESLLVVDDVKGQRDLAAEMLRRLNYRVASVSSGEEAVAFVRNQKVDLIVLDMIMEPGMDGLDTYRSILEIHPKQKAIIVSGFSETYRVNAAQVLGAGEYVRKPYVIEKLGLAVRKELDGK